MNSFYFVFFLVLFILQEASAIGFCRENHVCEKAPQQVGEICKCWSTCSPIASARQCDHANPDYTGYDREKIGKSDVSCSYIPFVHNSRDLCVWYYDPDNTEAAAKPPVLRQQEE